MIKWIKSKWYGLNKLNDLEQLILTTVRDNLKSEAVPLLDLQISSINKVSRLPDGVESIFYHINLKTGKPDFKESIKFPNKKSDLLISIVTLKFRYDKIEVEVLCEGGRILLLNFKGSANYWIEYMAELSSEDFFVVHCEILADLMEE